MDKLSAATLKRIERCNLIDPPRIADPRGNPTSIFRHPKPWEILSSSVGPRLEREAVDLAAEAVATKADAESHNLKGIADHA